MREFLAWRVVTRTWETPPADLGAAGAASFGISHKSPRRNREARKQSQNPTSITTRLGSEVRPGSICPGPWRVGTGPPRGLRDRGQDWAEGLCPRKEGPHTEGDAGCGIGPSEAREVRPERVQNQTCTGTRGRTAQEKGFTTPKQQEQGSGTREQATTQRSALLSLQNEPHVLEG